MPAFPPPEAAPPRFAPQTSAGTPQPGAMPAVGGETRQAGPSEAAVAPEPRYGVAGPATDSVAWPEAEEDLLQGHEERVAAYHASILANFGGRRGLAEVGLPSIVFIVVYTATRSLNPSLWSAVAVAAVMTVVRLAQRDKLQHALGGLFGVAVCAAFAKYTGQPKNFYLPGVLLNAGEALLFSVSALVRWPVVGVVIGPITGEMMSWREEPERLRAFTVATWLLVAMFVLRVAVEVPLYLANQITALGAAKVVLGYPLYIGVLFVCWRVIKKAPLPAQVS